MFALFKYMKFILILPQNMFSAPKISLCPNMKNISTQFVIPKVSLIQKLKTVNYL